MRSIYEGKALLVLASGAVSRLFHMKNAYPFGGFLRQKESDDIFGAGI